MRLSPCCAVVNPFPTLIVSDTIRVARGSTILLSAAADWLRALGYMVWMRTIDN